MPFDMFDDTFELVDPLTATGTIGYDEDQVDLLAACIIQVDGAGNITGSVYGFETGAGLNMKPGPIKNGKKTFKWELPVQMMPPEDGESRDLEIGVPATGLAFYRRRGAQVAMWATAGIEIKA